MYGSKQDGYNSLETVIIKVKKYSIVSVYVDACLIFSRKNSSISERLFRSCAHGKEQFELTYEDDLSKYIGFGIYKYKYCIIEFSQAHLIEILAKLIDQDRNINVRPT